MTTTEAPAPGGRRRERLTARVEHLVKRFGSRAQLVLDDVSLDVAPGRVRLPARRLRLRQVDAAQPGGRAGEADQRAASKAGGRPR